MPGKLTGEVQWHFIMMDGYATQTRHKATFEVSLFENMNEDSMVELHVRLLGEGTDCSRPTKTINTGNECQAEEIVADVIVESRFEIRHGHLLLHLALATNFLVLAVVKRVPSEMVNGTMLCGGHQPGARINRDARLRPLLERSDESVLREFLGKTHVADDPRDSRDDPGRLDLPDRVDYAMCIGGRQNQRSRHVRSVCARQAAPRRTRTIVSRPTFRASAAMVWEESLPDRRFGELRSRPPSPSNTSCEAP